MSPSASSRWCPTPEQLMILEELYRSGVRTPNASQIQRITAHLSFYGKIEGKNVFYWFQNHKARDRQKLRKKLIKQLQEQQQQVQCVYDHPNQLLLEQDQSNHHHFLRNYFDPLSLHPSALGASAFHQLPYHNYATSFSPAQDANRAHMMDQTWKVEIPSRIMEDSNTMMRRSMYGHDWMMMMSMEDVGPISSCCTNISNPTRPIRTLELFPITSTNLKEECNPSPSAKNLPCLTPFTE